MKTRVLFACTGCGTETTRWQGQCAGCGEWNTLVEMKRARPAKEKRVRVFGDDLRAP